LKFVRRCGDTITSGADDNVVADNGTGANLDTVVFRGVAEISFNNVCTLIIIVVSDDTWAANSTNNVVADDI
jgi:hypothetical protein